MSKITLLHACSLALLLCLPQGCGKDDDDGDSGGDDANDSAMTSADDGGDDDDDDDETDDFGDDSDGGSTFPDTTDTPETTDGGDNGDAGDEGPVCDSFFDCPAVICECPGGNVEIASCIDGMCANEDNCADPPHNACEG